MKKIALNIGIQVGVAMLAALIVSIVLGILIANVGGSGAATVLRDIGIIILAFLSLVMALIWAAIYFAVSVGVGWVEGKRTVALGWVNTKALWVETRVGDGMERFVARPLARAARGATFGTTFVRTAIVGPVERLDMLHEQSRWRTRINRMLGRAFPPATGREPRWRNERDVQPGPGIAV